MAATPFFWGSNGQKLSPAQVESLRAVAEARGTRPVAQNLGEGLGALGDALVVNAYQGRANQAETEGQKLVADALAAKDWQGVVSNEWASPGQQRVGSAMMDRGWQLEDRSANWAHDESLANRSRQWSLDDRNAGWTREDALRADERSYNEPLRALQLEGGQLDLDRTKAGYRQLVDPEERAAAGIAPDDAGMYQVDPSGQIAPITSKTAQPQPLINAGGGTIFDPNTGKWISNPDAPAGGAANFDDISGIRKEVQALPSYKNLAQATPIFNAMVETAGRDSRASDLNLVYGLGKIMDPTSVVREGEMFMVQGINTLPDKVIEGINSVLTGTSTLSPATRQAILTEAYGRVKGYEDAFGQDASTYKGLADRYKINPEDVLPGFQPLTPYTPQAPGDMPSVSDDAGYDALPSGATFKAPDGSIRKKP